VVAVRIERKLKPALGPAIIWRAAPPDTSRSEANVMGRLLKIELDPAKPECCTATSAVQGVFRWTKLLIVRCTPTG
jgi:hypothetical protein